jgi:hypothetical protein
MVKQTYSLPYNFLMTAVMNNDDFNQLKYQRQTSKNTMVKNSFEDKLSFHGNYIIATDFSAASHNAVYMGLNFPEFYTPK